MTLENGAKLYQDLLIDGGKRAKDIKKGTATGFPLEKESDKFFEQICNLIDNEEICVEEHHADQLLIFMAIAKGTSKIRTIKPISGHINGMIRILTQFLPEIKIDIIDFPSSTEIQIEGIDLSR